MDTLGEIPRCTWTDRLTAPQIEDLCALYRQEWWTGGRTASDVRRMLAHSDLTLACLDEAGRLAAFARVLTDRVYKAVVFDVIVAPAYRGHGLGRALMQQICAHPTVKDVQHIELYCRAELEPFYRQWGFTSMNDTLRLLRRET